MRYFSLLVIILASIFIFVTEYILAKDFVPDHFSLRANEVSYNSELGIVVAHGNVVIISDEAIIESDQITYNVGNDILVAEGNLSIRDRNGRIIVGSKAVLQDKLKEMVIDDFAIKLKNYSLIVSKKAEMHSGKKATLRNVNFSPCLIHCNQKPIWQIQAKDTELDLDKHVVIYKHLLFRVYGIPVLYTPYFSHTTPGAPASSGFLMPSLKNKQVMLPIYYRAASNLDFTISPRIDFLNIKNQDHFITELEMRHLVENGKYNVDASFGSVRYQTYQDDKLLKSKQMPSYHIFTKGAFTEEPWYYGFNINRTSDKAYLKNYHALYNSSLHSELYINKIEGENYISIEAHKFQDLNLAKYSKHKQYRQQDSPMILPNVIYKNIYALDDDTDVVVRNLSNIYMEQRDKQIVRNSLLLNCTKRSILPYGQTLNVTLSDRIDTYFVDIRGQNVQMEKFLARHIPQISTKLGYPILYKNYSNTVLIVEPLIGVVWGEKFDSKFNKFDFVDQEYYELTESNIFSSNRFSGIDHHEYGLRTNYGVNTSLSRGDIYLNNFIGKSLSKNNVLTREMANYVGMFGLDFDGIISVNYRFKKNHQLESIRDEANIDLNFDKIHIASGVTNAYFHNNPSKSKQAYLSAKYNIGDSLKLEASMHFNTKNSKYNILTRTIKVTYTKDCVSISVVTSSDFTEDKSRGIRKVTDTTYGVGLRVLSM